MELPVPTLRAVVPLAPDNCPVTLYLTTDLTTAVSRRGMLANLRTATRVLTDDRLEDSTKLPWWGLDGRHLARLRVLLLERGAAPASVNTILAGVKGVLRHCRRRGLMSPEQLADALDIKPARGSRVEAGRCLSDGEIRALFTVCGDDEGPAGVRDAALFGLALGAGLRRAELTALLVDDYHRPAGQAHGELLVAGKGRKQRKAYLAGGARDAVEDWLVVRGSEPGPLFVPINKGGKLDLSSQPMVGSAITQAMAKRARAALVEGFSPHDCRRTYVSGLLEAGVDISTAARLAGHASVETTRIYDRRGERAAVEAAGMVHIPYIRGRRLGG